MAKARVQRRGGAESSRTLPNPPGSAVPSLKARPPLLLQPRRYGAAWPPASSVPPSPSLHFVTSTLTTLYSQNGSAQRLQCT